jgi:hypothetical protein
VNQVDRQRVTWKFNPEISLPSGDSQTLTFGTVASATKGVYWSDLLVDFGGGTFLEDRYTWPTAAIKMVDSHTVSATDDLGNNQVLPLQAWISDDSGLVNTWNLQSHRLRPSAV